MNDNRDLYELTQRIRDFFNIDNLDRLEQLRRDTISFAMFCSCLDTIENTALTLQSFLTEDVSISGGEMERVGRYFGSIIKALTALVMQQDAIKNLHQSLQVRYIEREQLEEIRRIYIDAVGSPTNIGNRYAFSTIPHLSLSSDSFKLIKRVREEPGSDTLKQETEYVNVSDLISRQNRHIGDVLDRLLNTLRDQ